MFTVLSWDTTNRKEEKKRKKKPKPPHLHDSFFALSLPPSNQKKLSTHLYYILIPEDEQLEPTCIFVIILTSFHYY
jgi:hypothetical protein